MIVPEHIKHQSKYIKVGVLNCTDEKILKFEENDKYDVFYLKDIDGKQIRNLPQPFDKPDLVNFHGVYIPSFIKLYKELYNRNIPFIITPHGSLTYFAQSKKKLKKTIFNKLIFNKFINRANSIQYLTKEERDTSIIRSRNEIIVGNGSEIKKLQKNKKNDINEFNIVFIGRIDPYHKGIDLLVEACSLIKEEMKKLNIKVKIFGPDHEGGREQVSKLINKYKLNDIVYLGHALYDEDKDRQLKNTDIFILTSRFEGQPIGVLEAISKGIPVLVTEGTNISEDVEIYNCGFKADTDSVSISEQILNAYNNRHNIQKLSENCFNYAKDKFSWQKISNEIIEHYKSIIENN